MKLNEHGTARDGVFKVNEYLCDIKSLECSKLYDLPKPLLAMKDAGELRKV